MRGILAIAGVVRVVVVVGVVVVLVVAVIIGYILAGLERQREAIDDRESIPSGENGRCALAIRQRRARVWNRRGVSRNEEEREEEQAEEEEEAESIIGKYMEAVRRIGGSGMDWVL